MTILSFVKAIIALARWLPQVLKLLEAIEKKHKEHGIEVKVGERVKEFKNAVDKANNDDEVLVLWHKP